MSNLILHGATAQPQTLAQATVFDTATGIKQNVVQMFWSMQQGFKSDGVTPNYTNFPVTFADTLWKRGQLYLQTWGPADWVSKVGWSANDICSGRYDSYFATQAGLIKTWAHPLFIRLMHEFNGSWTYYGPANPPNKPVGWTPDDHVRVWRYVVSFFRAQGATNITWVWCPNALSPAGSTSTTASDKLPAYYPGDDVVDWTAFDAYNWGAPRSSQWLSFSTICSGSTATASWIGDTYGTIARIAPSKPMMIAEFGCHNVGGDRVAWIKDALATTPVKYPLVRAINYYNVDLGDAGATWPLLTGDGTGAAWAAGIKAGPYAQQLFPMPPDLQPILPLQSATWGDPTRGLMIQLAQAQQSVAALQTAHISDADQHGADLAALADAWSKLDATRVLLASTQAAFTIATQTLRDTRQVLDSFRSLLG